MNSVVESWSWCCHIGGLRFQLSGQSIPSCVLAELTNIYSQKDKINVKMAQFASDAAKAENAREQSPGPAAVILTMWGVKFDVDRHV